jgi:predicted NAD/FAD-binding protein
VLRDGLDAERSASDVLLARMDLTALFPEPAAAYVRERGGRVLVRQPVRAIVPDGSGYIVDTGGAQARHTHVICAVGPHQAHTLLPQVPLLAAVSDMVGNLRYQPIYTIYLQFEDRACLSVPMLGLREGIGQWVFDRGAIAGQNGLLAVVVSATGNHQHFGQPQLAQQMCLQLQRELGRLPPLRWHRVIAEKRATFGCTVNVQRPPRGSGLENLFLAGDYTACDYPATLESAVQSGTACARAVLS